MRVLPHLDDVGSSPGSVLAWHALREAGVVRSASLMVPCPYYPMARDDWLADPDQDMGIHITLTSEWDRYRWRPMIGPDKCLTDGEGYFHRRPEQVIAQADRSAIRDEITAQIERAIADGIRPTHLDAHMGTALYDPFVWDLIDAGKRYKLPVLACRDMRQLIDIVSIPHLDTGYLAEVLTEVQSCGWPVFDSFLIAFCPDDRAAEEHYVGMVRNAGPGLHFLAMHADTAEGLEHFAEHHVLPRRKEYELFSNPSSQALFDQAEAETIVWADLLGIRA